jgi:hypothetical protein
MIRTRFGQFTPGCAILPGDTTVFGLAVPTEYLRPWYLQYLSRRSSE